MTKEELEKEAEEWLDKWELCNKCENKVDCISNFSYCKKVVLQSYLASAEPREKRIAELEEAKANLEYLLEGRDNEIDELKKENKDLAQNLEDTEILNNTYEKRFDNLKKENAELQNKLEHRNCLDCSNHSSKLRMKTLELEKECTNAKEIIKLLLWDLRNRSYEPVKDIERAEQFLKEIEK